jgi:hypothetical protein
MIEHFVGRDDLLYYRLTLYGGILCESLKKPEEEDGSKSKAKQFLELMKGDSIKNKIRRKISVITHSIVDTVSCFM